MRRIAGWALILATVALPLHAQAVLLRLNPRDGMVTRNQMKVETFSSGGLLPQMVTDTTLPLFRATLWQTQTISDLTEEEFTVTQVLDSVQIESPALPMLADLAGEANDIMRGTVTIIRMTRRGVTRHLDMQLPEAMQGSILAQTLQGSLGGGGGAGGISSQMSVPFPERAIQVGDTWLDSLDLPMAASGLDSSGTVTYHTATSLRSIEGPVAVLGLVGTLQVAGGSLPGTRSTFAVTSELRFDLEAGHLASMTSEMTSTTPGPTGDIPVRVVMSFLTR